MTGFTTNTEHLTRSDVWGTEVKEILKEQLFAANFVRTLSDFPDGDTFNIPSIGQFEVLDYVEDESITFSSPDTGNFEFSITEYKQAGTYITNKMKQDSYYMSNIMPSIPRGLSRALMEKYEHDVMALSAQQTASNSNTINGAKHRFVAGGTNEVLELKDFAKARYALDKASVPQTGRIAIIDPSAEFAVMSISNLITLADNPTMTGKIETGLSTGYRFITRILGFDVYVSNFLADANETIDGTTTAAGKANMFFSTEPEAMPFIGAWRQEPKLESDYNISLQREEYVLTARYGLGLIRPEGLVCVLSDTDQVYA